MGWTIPFLFFYFISVSVVLRNYAEAVVGTFQFVFCNNHVGN